jgi:hypothetical protein
MQAKIFLGIIILILRTFIGIKVISWLILNFIENQSHDLSEIQTYLVIIILDMWATNNSTQIIVRKEDDEI